MVMGGVHPTTVCALVLLLAILSGAQCRNAVSEWGGVNSFLLHTLSASDRAAHLSAMQANGLKVVRIFISGVDVGAKGSSSVGVSELEPVTVGVYDDSVLQQVDTLMYEAAQYGVKLLIALHDRYSLGCWHADAYVSKYGITDVSPHCDTAVNQPTAFYTNASAQADFDRRIAHILTHKNPNFSDQPWGEINEAIFGFEPENEAEGHMDNLDWSWTCHRAAKMSQYISNGILIITGGDQEKHRKVGSFFSRPSFGRRTDFSMQRLQNKQFSAHEDHLVIFGIEIVNVIGIVNEIVRECECEARGWSGGSERVRL